MLELARPALRRVVRRRFYAIAPLVMVFLTGWLSVIAAVTVPPDVAEQWTEEAVGSVEIPLIDASLATTPYVSVGLLLAMSTTALFLSFLLVEESAARRLDQVLLGKPARLAIVLGVPYVTLAPAAVRELLARGYSLIPELNPDTEVPLPETVPPPYFWYLPADSGRATTDDGADAIALDDHGNLREPPREAK